MQPAFRTRRAGCIIESACGFQNTKSRTEWLKCFNAELVTELSAQLTAEKFASVTSFIDFIALKVFLDQILGTDAAVKNIRKCWNLSPGYNK